MTAYWIFLAIFLGFLVAFQPLINALAIDRVKLSGMLFLNAIVFMLSCAVFFVAHQGFQSGFFTTIRNMRWWLWTGGFLGAFIVGLGAWLFPRLGATWTLMLVVFGQLSTALIADHFGWLGIPRTPLNSSRIFGLFLVAVGCFFAKR